jgi:hypothetical protein
VSEILVDIEYAIFPLERLQSWGDVEVEFDGGRGQSTYIYIEPYSCVRVCSVTAVPSFNTYEMGSTAEQAPQMGNLSFSSALGLHKQVM